jgi:hypothetical protein
LIPSSTAVTETGARAVSTGPALVGAPCAVADWH